MVTKAVCSGAPLTLKKKLQDSNLDHCFSAGYEIRIKQSCILDACVYNVFDKHQLFNDCYLDQTFL